MNRQHELFVAQRRPQRVPRGIVKARISEGGRVLGEGKGVAALGTPPAHLIRAQLGIPEDRQSHRDESSRVRAAPLVYMPVVVGPHDSECQVLVTTGGEEPGTEAGEGRKIHGAEDSSGVHVLDALMDVEASGTHLVEGSGLDAVFLPRPTRHGVQADVGDGVPVELPDVAAVAEALHPGSLVLKFGRQPAREEAGWLDQMVIHTDHDQIVGVHGDPTYLRVELYVLNSTCCTEAKGG